MSAYQTMTRDVICVSPNDSLETARELMDEWEIRHLPVVEDRRIVGILSDRDILLHSHIGERGVNTVADIDVSAAMTPRPITCHPNESVSSIAALMADRKIDSVPVIGESDELVGLITSTDLLDLLRDREPFDSTGKIPWSYHLRIHEADGPTSRYLE